MIPRVALLTWLLLAAGSASSTRAGLVTYEFSGVLSGTLDGNAFADERVVFTLTADPDAITSTTRGPVPFRQTFVTAASTLEFTIGGLRGTFADLFHVFSFTFAPNGASGPASGTVGLSPEGPNNFDDLVDVRDGSLAFYDLASPQAPFAQSPPDFVNPGEGYPTSLGELILEEGDADSLTFRAFAILAVPEPATFATLIVGVLPVVALALRRRDS